MSYRPLRQLGLQLSAPVIVCSRCGKAEPRVTLAIEGFLASGGIVEPTPKPTLSGALTF